MNDFTCQALVHGIGGRLSMGVTVHKACFLLLAVLLRVLNVSILTARIKVRRAGSMFGQSVSLPDWKLMKGSG